MECLVTGVMSGTSKKGTKYNALHVVLSGAPARDGLRGSAVDTLFCSDEIASSIKPNTAYDLVSGFGSRTIISATPL